MSRQEPQRLDAEPANVTQSKESHSCHTFVQVCEVSSGRESVVGGQFRDQSGKIPTLLVKNSVHQFMYSEIR